MSWTSPTLCGRGPSIAILTRARHALDVALLNFDTTHFNHRDQAATVAGAMGGGAAGMLSIPRTRVRGC